MPHRKLLLMHNELLKRDSKSLRILMDKLNHLLKKMKVRIVDRTRILRKFISLFLIRSRMKRNIRLVRIKR